MTGVVPANRKIWMAEDRAMVANRSGSILGITSSGVNMCLENVIYLPQLSENLLSISKLMDRGYATIFTAGRVVVTHEEVQLSPRSVILWGKQKQNLNKIAIHERGCSQVIAQDSRAHVVDGDPNPTKPTIQQMSRIEFHERMNHLNFSDIDWLEQNGKLTNVTLVPAADMPKHESECEACILGKHCAGTHRSRNNCAAGCGEEIHLDSSRKQLHCDGLLLKLQLDFVDEA